MAFKLSINAEAENEYIEAVNWYKSQSAELADRFLVELAENQPAFYSFYVKSYRRILLKSFPNKIVFEIERNKVVVHAINHTSRSDDGLRNRLL